MRQAVSGDCDGGKSYSDGQACESMEGRKEHHAADVKLTVFGVRFPRRYDMCFNMGSECQCSVQCDQLRPEACTETVDLRDMTETCLSLCERLAFVMLSCSI